MRVIIAGGGTGGHLFPGVALAEEITTRQEGNQVLFVGTARGIEARIVPQLGYALELIPVEGLKGKGLRSRFRGVSKLPRALLRSWQILSKFKPDLALGVGGYASGPLVLVAWLRGIPTAVLEQNTVPGMTNRILGKVVRFVFVMFEDSRAFFPPSKVKVYGNPIRRQLLENFLRVRESREGRFSLLVLGGSQGAHGLNRALSEAAPQLALIEGLRIVHQTGKNDEAMVREAYQASGVDAEVVVFIDNMSHAYEEAHLVICRAGATTLAELMVAKRASVLVPFPFAADNHQELNARAMVKAGASKMVRESERSSSLLAEMVAELAGDPAQRSEMERAARQAGRPEAAREIMDACAELLRKPK